MNYCFYHSDLDGESAAAIIYKYLKGDIECIPVNYNNNFPFHKIKPDDHIIIVDFSLQKPGEWDKLLDITWNIIWIDHHKTAIEASMISNVSDLKGIREINKSGCVLTWEFFYPNTTVPKSVSLIGDYDIWKFEYGDMTKNFHEGLISMVDTLPDSKFWDDVLISVDLDIEKLNKSNKIIYDICDIGEKILVKQSIINRKILQSWSFEIDFLGYHCISINRGNIGSLFFESVADQYDILIPYIFDGEQYTVYLYHGKRKDLNLGEIAKQYQGGGHFGAAGFQCKELPFTIIKRLNKGD